MINYQLLTEASVQNSYVVWILICLTCSLIIVFYLHDLCIGHRQFIACVLISLCLFVYLFSCVPSSFILYIFFFQLRANCTRPTDLRGIWTRGQTATVGPFQGRDAHCFANISRPTASSCLWFTSTELAAAPTAKIKINKNKKYYNKLQKWLEYLRSISERRSQNLPLFVYQYEDTSLWRCRCASFYISRVHILRYFIVRLTSISMIPSYICLWGSPTPSPCHPPRLN